MFLRTIYNDMPNHNDKTDKSIGSTLNKNV